MTAGTAKKIFFTLLASLTVSGFIIICTMGDTVHRRRVGTRLAMINATESSAALYTVREYEGRIAVFQRENTSPMRVIDFDISLLSEYDRLELAEGIKLSSEAELRSYIQDITS